jgi:glycosyltransferase involved in cell wall biosynthesis
MPDNPERRDAGQQGNAHGRRLAGVRIAVDARYLSHPGMGIHNYLREGVKVLLEAGADVSLLTNRDDGEAAREFPEATWESFGSRRDVLWDQFSLPRRLHRGSFQFYWAPGNNGIPWWSTGSARTVSTTHDVIPLRLPRTYLVRRPLFAVPYLVFTLAAILRSDVLITVSEASARDIYRFFRRRATVISSYLSLTVDASRDAPGPHDLADAPYLIYTGGLDPRKNVTGLLAGFALSLQQLPHLRLVIIGRGTDSLRPAIGALGIADRVVLTGYVSDDEKNALLRGARAMIYPSVYEGFGLPILEAFAAGVPVITCRNSALAEVAGDAAVYVEPLSPASIAEGIAAALQEKVAERCRELGRRRLDKFDPLEARRRLAEIFIPGPTKPVPRKRRRLRAAPEHR